MANGKRKAFLELVRPGFSPGTGRTLRTYPEVLQALLALGPSEPKPT